MRTALSRLELLEPRRLGEALRLLAERGPLTILAGGTDIYVGLNAGMLPARRYLNLWPVRELARIERRDGLLRIGALATYSQLQSDREVRRHLPILATASREIGGVQIQNRGTIGGNIGNGSPAGDSLPVLAAADAVLELRSVSGARRVPFNEFYTGYRKSLLKPDELISAVEIPLKSLKGERQFFRKVGTRAAQAISKVVFAAIGGRFAFGSVAPTVIRAAKAEAAFREGGDPVRALREELKPIDDIRSNARYRLDVSCNLLAGYLREDS